LKNYIDFLISEAIPFQNEQDIIEEAMDLGVGNRKSPITITKYV